MLAGEGPLVKAGGRRSPREGLSKRLAGEGRREKLGFPNKASRRSLTTKA